MTQTEYTIAAAIAVLALLTALILRDGAAPGTALAQAVDIDEGRALYAANCASCHGADLEGQPDWRSPGPDGRLPAPPHDGTGHTWHHGDALLFAYTKLGGEAAMDAQGVDFDSSMPGFGDRLSDAEIRNIIEFIKSTWPERERQVQAARSRVEEQQEGD